FVDPEAADIVFGFNVKKILVPLDACNPIVLQLEDFKKLEGSMLYRPLMSMVKPYIKNAIKEEGIDGALMYDPLTVYAILNPEACESGVYSIRVDIGGDKTRGKLIAEKRDSRDGPRDTIVIEKISCEIFKKDFIGILKD
ncbi:nucleoside hydrolase, partial [Candidatus Woesearchaeota archaeon]|nr:nucleoside hydrolase [Candidatus Woesearchaeota archaeon]